MAAVSSYANGRGYSSHRQQEGGVQPWNFNVPIDMENDFSNSHRFAQNQHPSPNLNFNPPSYPRTPELNDHISTNGVSQSQTKAEDNFDPSYLSPKRGLRPGFSESRSGSEADSLLDLYGHPRSLGERSVANSMEKERGLPQEELYLDDEDPERSRWIHRDKLAIIESHEMQEAGIKLPYQQPRSASRSKNRREHTHDVSDLANQEAEMAFRLERKKRISQSPIRHEDKAEETLGNDFDLRTPEEIAGDISEGSPSNVYRQSDLRKSSSRIPLSRSSPMPIPQEHIERDTPLPRKRGASGTWTGEESGISYNKMRSRNNSFGSQVLLDDPDLTYNTPTPSSRPVSRESPSKTRIPSNNKPIHSWKPSLTNNALAPQLKSRTPSVSGTSPRTPSSSTTVRPKSRSSLDPRPATAVNRPEGEPPWLATMYKPDPRLPPDQQILPTHAKRIQQEQQQQREQRAQKDTPAEQQQRNRLDGKASPQLPRDFSPLAEHTVNGLQPSSREADEKALQERGESEWPLTIATPGRQQKPVGSNNPSASSSPLDGGTNQHGGYSTIPRVKQSDSPISGGGQQPGNQHPLDPFEKERLARAEKEKSDGAKEEKKEKGCGCCIVM